MFRIIGKIGMKLTDLDIRILAALQGDAKLSMQELAARTYASSTQVWRRLKGLEQAGVLEGYHAQLNAKAVRLGAMAYVQVALAGHDQKVIDRFLALVTAEDQVTDCASITGEYDFMLMVQAEDPEALEAFIMRRLLNSGVVARTQSNFVLRRSKTRGPLPLGHLLGAE
jgi:Lrp/AsnC family leucine-responsive transcriptional regulator